MLYIKKTDQTEEDEDKAQLQKAQERVQNIFDRIEGIFKQQKAEQDNRSIIQVTNKVLSLDPKKSQKEIYSGRYSLKISSRMPIHMQIEKFAGEEIAFHLHKKRDFLGRLQKHINGN